MDAAVAGLLGTAIGALAGVVGSFLTSRQQYRFEQARLRAARSDELVRAERQALLHLTELLATGTHAVSLLAWAAKVLPDSPFRQEIESYEKRMRELLPQMMSAQAAAAGLSDDAFERIDPLVEELFTLDATVGTAAAGFDEDKEEARRRIAATRTPAGTFSRKTIREVRELLRVSAKPDD